MSIRIEQPPTTEAEGKEGSSFKALTPTMTETKSTNQDEGDQQKYIYIPQSTRNDDM